MQTESIERREELLHEIELANEMAVKEAQMKEREKAQRTEELAQQVSPLLPTTFFSQSGIVSSSGLGAEETGSEGHGGRGT